MAQKCWLPWWGFILIQSKNKLPHYLFIDIERQIIPELYYN